MWYKIILFLFGLLLIFLGKRFTIHHWPYGKLLYVSGLVLSAGMVVVFLIRVIKRKV